MAVISRTSVRPGHGIRADRLNLARLGEAQQHGLHPQAHLAEFVEEQRAVIGLPHETRLVAIGAREAPADVAEEFRFEQGLGDAAAVDGHERTPDARALRVNQLRHDFLADPGLAQNQDLGLGSGGRLDVSAKLDEGRALTKQ